MAEPRNYQEAIKHNGRFEGQNNIKRIFFFGEQNSKDMFRDIRKKILLGDNVFINVYGSTECGGLVSEIEEKDIDTLYVYHYDYDNDTIVYSYGDGIKYKLSGGKSTRLLPEEEDKYPKQYRGIVRRRHGTHAACVRCSKRYVYARRVA